MGAEVRSGGGLADNAVTTSKLADDAVTRAKIDEQALQTARVAIAVAIGATEDEVVAWGEAFPDLNYTFSVSLLDAAGDLEILQVVAQAAGSITVRVRNNDALNAANGTLHAIATHD